MFLLLMIGIMIYAAIYVPAFFFGLILPDRAEDLDEEETAGGGLFGWLDLGDDDWDDWDDSHHGSYYGDCCAGTFENSPFD